MADAGRKKPREPDAAAEGEKRASPSGPEALDGQWPPLIKQFWWDLVPARFVPGNSGLKEPRVELPAWVNDPKATTELALEVARGEHTYHDRRAATAEDKANRLAQRVLALLTVTFTLGGYEASKAQQLGGRLWFLALVPGAIAVFLLAWAGIGALEVDRVGLYPFAQVGDLIEHGDESPTAILTKREISAASITAWTANRKLTQLMSARAQLTRGLVAVVVASVVGVWLTAATTSPHTRPTGNVAPTPTGAVTTATTARR